SPKVARGGSPGVTVRHDPPARGGASERSERLSRARRSTLVRIAPAEVVPGETEPYGEDTLWSRRRFQESPCAEETELAILSCYKACDAAAWPDASDSRGLVDGGAREPRESRGRIPSVPIIAGNLWHWSPLPSSPSYRQARSTTTG